MTHSWPAIFALLLDATKAFDRVKYSKLFRCLLDKNVCPVIIRLVLNMYMLSSALVNWNNVKSESFPINNGVKQGGVISPLFFAVYLDPLLDKLQSTKQGCYIGNTCCNAFAYADDVILLTPTCAALRVLIKVCEQYSRDVNLQFNTNKCVLLVFANYDIDVNIFKIEMFNEPVPKKLCDKHLGHILDTKGPIVKFDEIIRTMKVRTNVVTHNFHSISYKSKAKLFNSQCLALYGCPIWNLQDDNFLTLCKTWRICCRQIMNMNSRTSSYLIPHIMDSLPIDLVVMERMLIFFVNGLNHPSKQISGLFLNSLVSCSSYSITNVNIILKSFGIKYCELFNIKKNEIRKKILQKLPPVDWRCNMIKELLCVLDGEMDNDMDYDSTKDIFNYVCTL